MKSKKRSGPARVRVTQVETGHAAINSSAIHMRAGSARASDTKVTAPVRITQDLLATNTPHQSVSNENVMSGAKTSTEMAKLMIHWQLIDKRPREVPVVVVAGHGAAAAAEAVAKAREGADRLRNSSKQFVLE